MKLSAEQGYVDAQYELGILLLEGNHFLKTISNNTQEGFLWLTKAMEQGYKEATEIMELKDNEKIEPNVFSEWIRNKIKILLEKPELADIEINFSSSDINNISSQNNAEHLSEINTQNITNTMVKTSSSHFSFFNEVSEKEFTDNDQFQNEETSSSSSWCTIA
ncbi:MAG: hypothetical protein LEGION0398_MBIBDBAK_01371 [Legionellaceae bacterium]